MHGLIEKSVQLPLKAGWHPIRIEWFNATGGLDLSLELEGPGVHRRPLRAADLATETAESRRLASALKARGFRFIGPVSAYAFMQSMGLVDDHLAGCHRATS